MFFLFFPLVLSHSQASSTFALGSTDSSTYHDNWNFDTNKHDNNKQANNTKTTKEQNDKNMTKQQLNQNTTNNIVRDSSTQCQYQTHSFHIQTPKSKHSQQHIHLTVDPISVMTSSACVPEEPCVCMCACRCVHVVMLVDVSAGACVWRCSSPGPWVMQVWRSCSPIIITDLAFRRLSSCTSLCSFHVMVLLSPLNHLLGITQPEPLMTNNAVKRLK